MKVDVPSTSSLVHQAVCGYGAQDALPFRSGKEGELFFVEDREINLIELALATNIPKGCAETMVRGVYVCTRADTRAKARTERGASALWQ